MYNVVQKFFDICSICIEIEQFEILGKDMKKQRLISHLYDKV